MRLKYIEKETCFIINYIFIGFAGNNAVDRCTICTRYHHIVNENKFWVLHPTGVGGYITNFGSCE
jgi:hypothetical protein